MFKFNNASKNIGIYAEPLVKLSLKQPHVRFKSNIFMLSHNYTLHMFQESELDYFKNQHLTITLPPVHKDNSLDNFGEIGKGVILDDLGNIVLILDTCAVFVYIKNSIFFGEMCTGTSEPLKYYFTAFVFTEEGLFKRSHISDTPMSVHVDRSPVPRYILDNDPFEMNPESDDVETVIPLFK